ncbi:MAG: hypothetical protein ABF475_00745, partial [Liquorilactobacillus nagelii]|uniref:hypothetical protein n=1 Tax=Liquorilactobacillus nagelii TaxID=82688 RepID=UPI0039ECDF46
MKENKKKSTKKIVTATAVTIGVTALTAMAPLTQVPGVTNHEPNTTIKAAAISKSQVALQYGTLKVAMKGPTGHVYPAGTQVVRHSSTGDSNSNFEENFFLAMVSTGPSPIGGMQPVVAGEINTQYVTITNTVVETVPSDETVILNNITEADYNNGGAITPATQAQVDKTALNAAISKAQGIISAGTSQYTDTSVNTMKTAMANAQSIAANNDATQAQVDSATSALNTAINGLAKPTVDKSNLQATISKAKSLLDNSSKYTAATIAALQTAYNNAVSVNNNDSATQDQVTNANLNLNVAINNLEDAPSQPSTPTVDRTDLQKAISVAQADLNQDTSKYTDDSVQALKNALNSAIQVNNADNVTESKVDDAMIDLNNAIAGLTEKNPESNDKVALGTEITKAQSYTKDASKYTKDSVDNLNAKIASATIVYNNASATTAQIEAAIDDLMYAIEDLQDASQPSTPTNPSTPSQPSTPAVNYTALTNAHNSAQSILKGDTSKYTDATVQALKTADNGATQVLNNKSATQAQVDAATSTLNNAINGLKEKTPSNQNGQTNGSTPTTKNGQVNENGHWYLYKNGVKQTGMQTIPEQHKTVYYNSNGQMQYGQQKINGH